MMKVLIVYEANPDGCEFYLVEADEKQVDILKQCHNRFINSDDMNEGMEYLNIAISEKQHLYDGDENLPHASIWLDKRIDRSEPFKVEADLIVYTGFMQ